MLTLFSVPKPFRGHVKVIQSNALQSWVRLSPSCEIILFGDEEGIDEATFQFRVRHIPKIARNEYGTPLLDDVFSKVQEIAANDILCYINADIILMSDFIKAVEAVRKWKDTFLIVGRRWDIRLGQPFDFSQPHWEERLRTFVDRSGKPTPPEWIDYFIFPRGLYRDLAPFTIGRAAFDNWLLWKAHSLGAPIIDASKVVTVVHQNHDYSHHPQGQVGVWEGAEAQHNRELMGGCHHCFTLADSTYVLTQKGLKPNLCVQRLIRLFWTRGMVRYLIWALERIFPFQRCLRLYQSRKVPRGKN